MTSLIKPKNQTVKNYEKVILRLRKVRIIKDYEIDIMSNGTFRIEFYENSKSTIINIGKT